MKRRQFLQTLRTFLPLAWAGSIPALLPTSAEADIQAQIEAAALAGGGVVNVPAGTVNIAAGLQLRPGVTLQLDRAATLRAVADVDVVRLANNSRLYGGLITTGSAPNFTHAAVLVDGADGFGYAYQTFNEIANVNLHSGTYTGVGLHLRASTPGAKITGLRVRGVTIDKFADGLRLEAIAPASGVAYVNGNLFDQLAFYDNVRHVALLGHSRSPNAVNGNVFTGALIQAGTHAERAVMCQGAYNQFLGWQCYDAGQIIGGVALEFSESSDANRYVGLCAPAYVSDLGQRNVLELSG